MSSDPSLLPFEDAIDRLLEVARPLPPEEVALSSAAGRVLARPVQATEDVPASPISAMDGYAVPQAVFRAISGGGEARARVAGEVPAGRPWTGGFPGDEAVVRIFTGGVVPPWAAAVVMQEQAAREAGRVTLRGPVKERAYIRDAGSDVRAGQEVLAAGAILTPPAVGLLASLGVAEVTVRRRPRVGVVVTGSEVVSAGPIRPGEVRDSNGPALEAAAWACGAGEVFRATAPDDPEAVASIVRDLLPKVDFLLTSGGVSVGDYDFLRDVLESLGTTRLFWRVAQRPGKPLYAGTLEGRPVLGLPGNPASALATFLCHAWPALRRMQGAAPERVRCRAVMASPATKAPGFTAMLRGRRRSEGPRALVETTGPQESHQMLPFARADCLILGPFDRAVLEPGLEVEVVPFPWALPA